MDSNEKFSIAITEDGSPTIYSLGYEEHYHSVHGARTETNKIFIDYGLLYRYHNDKISSIRIFEVGFGTGLNALQSAIEASKYGIKIEYYTIELHPLPFDIYNSFGKNITDDRERDIFLSIHQCPWGQMTYISDMFSINKIHDSLLSSEIPSDIGLVYFDAFSPNTQPELWTKEVFFSICKKMTVKGVLTTYCSKGQVRRDLSDVGFVVERLPGPPHKREVIRATKK